MPGEELVQSSWDPVDSPPPDSLNHARLLWESEQGNADRIRQGVQVVSGGTLALLSIGLYNLVWLYEAPSVPALGHELGWVCVVALFFSVVCLALCLATLYIKSPQRRLADGRLVPAELKERKNQGLPPWALPRGTFATDNLPLTIEDVGKNRAYVIVTRITLAYRDLHDRNTVEAKRLQRGKQWFGLGICLAFLAILVYLSGSANVRLHGTGVPDHERDHHAIRATDFRGRQGDGSGSRVWLIGNNHIQCAGCGLDAGFSLCASGQVSGSELSEEGSVKPAIDPD